MLPNASSLMSSGTALVFKSLAELQSDAAQMENANQTLLQQMYKYEPYLLKGALYYAEQQGSKQMQDGWFKFGEAITGAAVTAACVVIGNVRNPLPEDNPTAKVNLEADDENEIELESLESEESENVKLSGNCNSETSVESDEEDETITLKAKNNAKKTKQADEDIENQDQIELDKKARLAIQGQDLWTTLIAPKAAAVAQSAFTVGDGYVQKEITEDSGNSTYMQGSTQMLQATISQTNANVQSREQQEKSAADAFIQVEQLSGYRA